LGASPVDAPKMAFNWVGLLQAPCSLWYHFRTSSGTPSLRSVLPYPLRKKGDSKKRYHFISGK